MKWFFVRFCFFCKYVWNLYKFTFLNRSEPNFPHVSPWSGRDRRVCMGPKFLTSLKFWALFSSRATAESWAQDGCRRDILISVVPAGVCVTSPTLRCRSRRSHPWQPYIRDSSWSSPNVAEITL